MSLQQLFHLIETLSEKDQEQVAEFVQKLKGRTVAYGNDDAPTVRLAEEPDFASLYGLTKGRPLDLGTIRKKAWGR